MAGALTVALAVALAAGVLLWPAPQPSPLEAAHDRIAIGMTVEEARSGVGAVKGASLISMPEDRGIASDVWVIGEEEILEAIYVNGRVTTKAYDRAAFGPWARLRAWLGL